MNEDTVRTRALNAAKDHWKPLVSILGSVALASITAAVTWGKAIEHGANLEVSYQADKVAYQVDKARFESKLDRIERKLDALADLPAQFHALDERQTRMEDNWDNAFQHAGDWPRPRKHK